MAHPASPSLTRAKRVRTSKGRQAAAGRASGGGCLPNLVTSYNNNPVVETRQQTAFRWSVEELFGWGRPVYFWTFTMVDAIPSWHFGPTWQRCLNEVYKYFRRFYGVRVFEWHRNHGLHAHMLCDMRLSVHVVRRIAKRYGFGRLQVVRADYGAALYLAKYLGKDAGKIPYGGRQWARIGRSGVRCNQVRFQSPRSDFIKSQMPVYRAQGMTPFMAMLAAREEFDLAPAKAVLDRWDNLEDADQ